MDSQVPETVQLCKIQLRGIYDNFVTKLESTVNKLDERYASDVATEPKKTEERLRSLQGTTGLMIFSIQHHGDLLNMLGKRCKARRYDIGNPLTAIQMTVHDIRAAHYAPLRMIAYEDENQQGIVEYELPSSLFGRLGNSNILDVALGLDEKLLHAIAICDKEPENKLTNK